MGQQTSQNKGLEQAIEPYNNYYYTPVEKLAGDFLLDHDKYYRLS